MKKLLFKSIISYITSCKIMTAIFNCIILLFLLGCSNDDSPQTPDDEKFDLYSENLDCSSSGIYTVPFSGKTFTINVEASNNIEWSVSITSGNLLSITPEGMQKGNGVIEIKIPENPEKELGRTGTVTISCPIKNYEIVLTFEQKEKEFYIPEGTAGQSTTDFQNPTSRYNIYYMLEGENINMFWDKSLGIVPTRFDGKKALEEADKTFRFLKNEVGFASKLSDTANKYKFLIFIQGENTGTAYALPMKGVGMIFLGPNHLEESEQKNRYGIYYHEMCHCFQFTASQDGKMMGGPINEMTSQYAMVRRFPNWMQLEPGHVNAFMRLSHLALGHEANGYHSPWVLEYWENKRGPHMVSKIWEEANTEDNKDFVATYKRISKLDQEKFNDELFDAYRHFITWDIPSIKEESYDFINKHSCKLIKESNNSYRISPNYCPQNYGYNGIELKLPDNGKEIIVNFTGMPTTEGYKIENQDEKGWRIGFVGITNNGERIYSEMSKTNNAIPISYKVPSDIKNLWLVIMAAPTKHHKHVVNTSLGENQEKRIYTQWPYRITLINTEPKETFIE